MKFALIDGKRTKAGPSATGKCIGCGSELIAKCGNVRVWHWAHKGNPACDPWWENITEWHRAWQEHFPEDWQEIRHLTEDGVIHIADVKTSQGWVLEFQHSFLSGDERRSREDFYPNLVWVVDGTRRKRDKSDFIKALEQGMMAAPGGMISDIPLNDGALLRDWSGGRAPVFFDFGEDLPLWCLLPGGSNGRAYVGRFSRKLFIELHRGGKIETGEDFAALFENLRVLVEMISEHAARQQVQMQNSRRHQNFSQLLQRQRRFQKRF